MRLLAALALLSIVALLSTATAAKAQSFEVSSVKPSTVPGPACVGGPGTEHPGIWRCTGVPLSLVISKAFGFPVFQFSPRDPCCMARFDFDVRFPPETTREQFQLMLQHLLRERFQLAFHYQQKELPLYKLAVVPNGLKLKLSAPAQTQPDDPWWASAYEGKVDSEGYPVFPAGRGGLAGGGHYRWLAFGVTMREIASTLQDQTGRPVIDTTGLTERYDLDLKWVADTLWQLSDRQKAEIEEQVGRPLESPTGPTLFRAVRNQLGLLLNAGSGRVEVVVVDHIEKLPSGN